MVPITCSWNWTTIFSSPSAKKGANCRYTLRLHIIQPTAGAMNTNQQTPMVPLSKHSSIPQSIQRLINIIKPLLILINPPFYIGNPLSNSWKLLCLCLQPVFKTLGKSLHGGSHLSRKFTWKISQIAIYSILNKLNLAHRHRGSLGRLWNLLRRSLHLSIGCLWLRGLAQHSPGQASIFGHNGPNERKLRV